MELSENLLKLTGREIQVMKLISEGKLGKEIATEMRVGRRAVEGYIYSARKKLNASCQAHAISICYCTGILMVPKEQGM